MLEDLINLLREAANGMVTQASIDRGANWITAMKSEFPLAHTLTINLLYKEPKDVMGTLALLQPNLYQYRKNPHALEFISRLQAKLRGEGEIK